MLIIHYTILKFSSKIYRVDCRENKEVCRPDGEFTHPYTPALRALLSNDADYVMYHFCPDVRNSEEFEA